MWHLITGCSHHRVVDAAGRFRNPDFDLEIVNPALNLFNNVRNIQRDRLGYFKNRLHTSRALRVCRCTVINILSFLCLCPSQTLVCVSHTFKGNSWEGQVLTHQGSGKQGGHRHPANTQFTEAEFTITLVLYGFTHLHCAKVGSDSTGTAAVGGSDPAAELHSPMHSFYLSFHCSLRKKSRKNVAANGWIAKRNLKNSWTVPEKDSWASLHAY